MSRGFYRGTVHFQVMKNTSFSNIFYYPLQEKEAMNAVNIYLVCHRNSAVCSFIYLGNILWRFTGPPVAPFQADHRAKWWTPMRTNSVFLLFGA